MARPYEGAWFVLLALALRLYNLDGESVWLDEAYSVSLARQSLSQMVATVWAGDLHPPLFYLALHGWLEIVPATPFWLRLPQAFVGAASVGVLFVVARQLAGLPAGRCCALLAATSHYLWLFDRECRMYPWVGLALLGYLLSLQRLSGGASRWWSLLTVGSAWLGAYCDYRFGLFALLVGSYYLCKAGPRRWIWLTLLVGAAGCAPLVPLMRHQIGPAGAGTRLSWCNDPITVASFAKLAPAFSGAWYLELPTPPLLAITAVLLGVLFLGLRRSGLALPPLGFAGQLAAILVFSLLKGSIYSVHSSYTMAYPFLLWLGVSVALLPGGARTIFLVAWVGLNLTMMVQAQQRLELHKQNWNQLAKHLMTVVQPEDVVVVVPAFQGHALKYYHHPRRLLELNPVDLLDKQLTDQLRITRRTWWVFAGDSVIDPTRFARNWVQNNLQVVSGSEIRNGPFHEICGRSTQIYLAVPKTPSL